ncbi:MAG: ABC transporter permease [Planctomycetota bacterium]|jgi:phospholipid/cholesterol/gamma-HCH transport system permease protein|nr:ABC transporter permease [Planctomycetota bacterium]
MLRHVTALGGVALDGLRGVGEVAILFFQCLAWLARGLPYKREVVEQFYFIGVQSLPVILTTGAFTGAVLAYTSYNQFVALGVESWTGAIVAKAQVWQLGPVLVGLMLAGRVGCSITAEIGTMNVTEQIDALSTMGTDPVRYLVLPRVIASFFMTPVLTIFAMMIGIIAGLGMTVFVLGAEWHFQWVEISEWMVSYDYVQGLSKSLVFGVTISLICCRNGLKTTGGAEGVGKATTTANVASCIAILILNLVMSIFLFYAQPLWDRVADIIAYAVSEAMSVLIGWWNLAA